MRRIDEVFLEHPFFGSRQMARFLRREGIVVGRHRIRRLMRVMGLRAIYRAPRMSDPHPGHKIYPYLLRGLAVTRANHVWCTDISYIPMRRGFLYLVTIMDWHSRKILSWRLSNTMDTAFCLEALEEALARYGPPDIFNSDQGSQFTSLEFTQVLKSRGIRISMDGKGRWRDNVYVERFWRSVKYECVYLHAFETGSHARRRHRALDLVLQRAQTALHPRHQNPGRGLHAEHRFTERIRPCRRNLRSGGVKLTTGIHLKKVARLSHDVGPLQSSVRGVVTEDLLKPERHGPPFHC